MTPLPDYLLHPILANPADDLLRLSAADWWEENGESELAEFVRLQIAKFHDKKNSPREQKLYYRKTFRKIFLFFSFPVDTGYTPGYIDYITEANRFGTQEGRR